MNAPVKCPKCGEEMKEGFVVDHGYVKNYVAQWVAGKPEFGPFGGTCLLGKEKRPIRTFCCTKCGYLEAYAPTT